MNYDKIPHLFRVANVETGEVHELFAKNNLDALCKVPGGAESDPFCSPFRVTEMLTPEGYRITLLRLLPKGAYFNLVAARGQKPTHTRMYVRGDYDRSYAMYECSHFDNFCHTRLMSGRTLVTIDMTF